MVGGNRKQVLRNARGLAIPLVAHSMGLGAVRVGALTSTGNMMDLAVSPCAGWLMDKAGR